MKKLFALALCVVSFAAQADYLYDAKSMDRWSRVDSHTIILSRSSTPKTVVSLPYCYINSGSTLTVDRKSVV